MTLLVLTSLCGSALGVLASSLFENVAIAVMVAPLLLLPLVIYGGFFVNNENSPAWLAWLQWASSAQYSFTGLIRNELEGRTINGVPGELQLNQLGALSRFSVGLNIVFLAVIYVVILLLAYMALYLLLRRMGYGRHHLNKMRKEILERQEI
jgi:ATP-binding cassette subfamily G (WHITE) protein 1